MQTDAFGPEQVCNRSRCIYILLVFKVKVATVQLLMEDKTLMKLNQLQAELVLCSSGEFKFVSCSIPPKYRCYNVFLLFLFLKSG